MAIVLLINSHVANAQGIGCANPGGNPECASSKVVIDVLISIDETFVAASGGVSEARKKAEDGVIEGFSELNSALSGTIDLQLNIVQFPNIVVPTSVISSVQGIKDYISNAGYTHAFDLYIHISAGSFPGGAPSMFNGITLCSSNDGAKSFIWARAAKPTSVAHEVMHYLGRTAHLDKPPFEDGPCNLCGMVANDGHLMCSTALGFLLTPCDHGCVRKLLEMGKCDCIRKMHPAFGPNETVSHPLRPSIVTYSKPVFGCKPSDDIAVFKVTMRNNTNQTIQRNIRLRLSTRASELFTPILDQNFNTIVQSGVQKEIQMVQNGQELQHEILPDKVVEFEFRAKLIANDDDISANSIIFKAYTGQDVNSGLGTNVEVKVPASLSNATLSFFRKDIFVPNGNLTLFEPFGDIVNGVNVRVYMGSGTAIKMNSNVFLKNVDIVGCTEMWSGIELAGGKTLDIAGSVVSDARIGIHAKPNSEVKINGTSFTNNDLGVYLESSKQSSLSSSEFSTSSLLPAYLGQNPVPGTKGFGGIFVKNSKAITVGNTFLNLKNGIIGTGSEVISEANNFLILRYHNTVGFGNITGFLLPHSGMGIFVKNGILNSLAGTTMAGVHTGVYAMSATISITNNDFSASNFGVKAILSNATITDSHIEASEVGVSAMATTASIVNNKIIASGSATATGIRAGGDDYWLIGRNALISENIINAEGVKAVGIHLPFSNGVKLVKNTIVLSGGSKAAGILLDGGYGDLLQCNTITGTAQAGILSDMAAYPTLECNKSNGTSNGIWFEGSSLGKFGARVQGNKMTGPGIGLRLGDVAAIGEQRHRGNIFDGASAESSNPDAHLTSKFYVNPVHNPLFYPTSVNPDDWFEVEDYDGATFVCKDGIHCPLPSILPPLGKQEVVKIIENTGGTSLGGQAQAWNTKVRLYHALQTESNPWQEEQKVTEFLANNANTDLGLYANMRAALGELIFQSEPKSAEIQTLLNQNYDLPVFSPWHLPEKQVNRIVLQTIGIQQGPSHEQKEELISIVGLCAQEYGEAVLRAKALLYLFDTPFTESDCISQPVQERMSLNAYNAEEIQIRIAPNPVTDRLAGFVQIPEQEMTLPSIEIRDTYGTLRKIILMKNKLHHLDEDVSEFEPGIYFLSVVGTEKTKATTKVFTVLK